MVLGPYRLTIRRADGTRVREKRLLSRFRLASINRNSGKRWAKGEQLRGGTGKLAIGMQGVDKNELALRRIADSAFPKLNVDIGDNLCVTPGQPRIARRGLAQGTKLTSALGHWRTLAREFGGVRSTP
jgi:hypothetical protein